MGIPGRMVSELGSCITSTSDSYIQKLLQHKCKRINITGLDYSYFEQYALMQK